MESCSERTARQSAASPAGNRSRRSAKARPVRYAQGRRNQEPLEDFHGSSPDEMHLLLKFPYQSPELLFCRDAASFHMPPQRAQRNGVQVLSERQHLCSAI
jgi:hypothetical protein